jgi:DNA modification methylase
MSNIFACEPYSIILGNAIEVLKQLQPKVDCVVTSPPYYQQRSYGTDSAELGREPLVAEYIGNLVAVFKAIPLEPWASVWFNIGDKRGKQGELQSLHLEQPSSHNGSVSRLQLLGVRSRNILDHCDL